MHFKPCKAIFYHIFKKTFFHTFFDRFPKVFMAKTMVCFIAFSPKADQMPNFGLLLVFFFVEKSIFYEFSIKE